MAPKKAVKIDCDSKAAKEIRDALKEMDLEVTPENIMKLPKKVRARVFLQWSTIIKVQALRK